jgi:apolipoprotein N-acyltransferase
MNPYIKYLNKRFIPITGLLLWLTWPAKTHFTPLIFIALVPLLLRVIAEVKQNNKVPYKEVFLNFLVWNILSTWWIGFASVVGAVIAVLLNSLLFLIPFLTFKYYQRIPNKLLFVALFSGVWIDMEWFHSSWQFAWPWLSLGNAFADYPFLVQWYEYTGTFGGSLWIIWVNFLIAFAFLETTKKAIYPLLSVIILPIILSLSIYFSFKEEVTPINITVVQPNVDPYSEKFDENTLDEQLNTLLSLSKSVSKENTELILWPETAFPQTMWEEQLNVYKEIDSVRALMHRYPSSTLISGASTARQFKESTRSSIRSFRNGECCYESYNAAVQFIRPDQYKIYHKSKLVPGVEQIPYESVLGIFGDLSLDLGGTTGKQEERTVFFNELGVGFAPIICYESVFGEYVTDYVKNGAQILCIVTNDGWWRDTEGYVQHFKYARLRAIENRRAIARSANTGISGFINQRGDVISESKWWEPAALNETINLNSNLTFYTKFGDWIAYLSMLLALGILIRYWFKK